jgi:UDP-N-acetylglucosamine--dolichyl-phosphate N-acetylglucosaminephosphotransferase
MTAAFAIAFVTMPFIIERMKARKIVGRDMNKYSHPEIAEMGGIPVIFGLAFGITVSIFCFTFLKLVNLNLTLLLAGTLTVLLVGFIGFVDDLIGWRQGIRQWQHALFPLFAALPLMAARAGTTTVNIPFFGLVPFGIYYSLVLVPIGITGASNAFNLLAGFNGLEAGLGIISAVTLLIISVSTAHWESALLLSALIGALLAFLYYNWFPAKVFGGDVVTLMNGATIAAASIIGDMEKIGLMIVAIFFIEFFLKARHRFQSQCFGVPKKNGTLAAVSGKGSITQIIMETFNGKIKEPQVTIIILGLQTIVCIIVLFLFAFKLIR